MGGVGLSHPQIAEYNGLWYLLGYADGMQYVMRSVDRGATWLEFPGGSTRCVVGASDNDAGSIVKLSSQGSRLVVALPRHPHIHIYVSRDDGENWELESTVVAD